MKILIAESHRFSTEAMALLRRTGEVIEADLDRNALLSAVGDADVLWVRLRNRVDAEVLAAGKNLRIVVSATTGLNHIDVEEAARRGIQVLSLQGEEAFLRDVRATAELTIGLLLALMRQIPAAAADASAGKWDRDAFQGRELYGKTAGIVGYGRLGRIVARYLQAFGMRVVACDPHVDPQDYEAGVTPVPLEQLLAESDVVSLHVNLTSATRGFFGHAQIAAMRRGAWLVNTSRGEVIDEAALIDALNSGRLAGAALDVLCDEDSQGMGERPLVAFARDNPRLIVTPHIGGCTKESMEKTEEFLAERLVTALAAQKEGGNDGSCVNGPNNEANLSSGKDSAGAAQIARPSAAKNTLGIFATRLVTLPLTIITSILVVRALGPTQRGVYEFLVLQGSLALPLLIMGFNASATYFVASKRYSVNDILVTCLSVGFLQGCVGTLLLGFLWHSGYLGETAAGTGASLMLPVLLILPLQSAILSLTRLAQGDSWFALNNRVQFTTALMTAVMLLSLVVAAKLGVLGAVVGMIVTNVLVLFGTIVAFMRRYRPSLAFHRTYVRDAWRYGLKAWSSDVAVQTNARLDKWILGMVAAPDVLGLYGPVVTISEILWMAPDAIAFVLQNKIAESKSQDEQSALAERLNRVVFWTMLAGGVTIAALAPWLVVLLYGKAFADSALPLALLMPGTVIFCVSKVLNKYFAGTGHPHFSGTTVVIGGVAGLLLYLQLIPRFGIAGAAIAHSACYIVTSLAAILIYRRLVAPRKTRLFRPTIADFLWLQQQARQILVRVEKRASV